LPAAGHLIKGTPCIYSLENEEHDYSVGKLTDGRVHSSLDVQVPPKDVKPAQFRAATKEEKLTAEQEIRHRRHKNGLLHLHRASMFLYWLHR
jgi:hypothetical protein